MKYNAFKLPNGDWAVGTPKSGFYAVTRSSVKKEAIISACIMSAGWHRDQMDKLHTKLEGLGAIDSSDPLGYLA